MNLFCRRGILLLLPLLFASGGIWAQGKNSGDEKRWDSELRKDYAAQFLLPSNPLGFPEYEQILTVTYPTSEEAGKVKVSISEMPDQQILAFSTRWDDVNKNHLRMAKLLQKNHMNGTFFLTRPYSDYYGDIAEKILESGSKIGSHTLNHHAMPKLLPNQMFYQCMMNRVELESNLDTNVVSFVLPGCALGSRIEDDTTRIVGSVIQRCGFLASPEFWNDTESRYGLPSNTCFPTHLFSINDRDPKEKDFEKGLEARLKQLKATPSVPHITFGIHTWQNEEGFQILDKIYEKYGKNPEWWYCTQNDYAAYRYQFFHTKIQQERNEDGRTIFRIRRITPHHLGSAIPLTLQIQPRPQSVFLNGEAVPRTPGGLYKLPHHPDRKISQLVDSIRNENNLPFDENNFESKKVPGLSASVYWNDSAQQFHAVILNRTRFRIRNLNKTLYFPMKWKNRPFSIQTWELLPGGKDSFVFKPSASDMNTLPEFQEGDLFFVLQCDFLLEDKPIRLYATTLMKRPFVPKACPRDTAVFLGPFADGEITEQQICNYSNPEKSLKNPGLKRNLRWLISKTSPESRFYLIAPHSPDKDWYASARPAEKGSRLIAFDFESDSAGGYRLFCFPKETSAVYLNGRKLEKISNGIPLQTKQGINRIIVAQKLRDLHSDTQLAVAKTTPMDGARCIRPELPK